MSGSAKRLYKNPGTSEVDAGPPRFRRRRPTRGFPKVVVPVDEYDADETPGEDLDVDKGVVAVDRREKDCWC